MITINNEFNPELSQELSPELSLPPESDAKKYIDSNYSAHYIENGQLRQRPYNWKLFDQMYNDAKRLKIPYNTIIAMMANVGIESGGYEDAQAIDWNHKKGTPWRNLPKGGRGLIQFVGGNVPKNQLQYLYNSVLTPATSENYWIGGDTYRKGLHQGIYNIKDAVTHYRKRFVRPGVFGDAYNLANHLSKVYKKYQQGNKIITINGI